MRYLELSKEAKENALNDYCECMNVELHPAVMDDVIKWFKKYNHNVFNENGLLMHRKNR
jgi:hypothetical protein|tara:strand:- start:110 stop:286 length:177 start_codon:yes stop_codon:yes gene_type:complete